MVKGEFNKKSVDELVDYVKNCKGHFAFLIGAGTSREAGIPTAKELIEEWQKKKYDSEGGNPENINDFQKWIKKKEKGKKDNRYGFWFEQCYPTRGERREFIREIVENKEPSFGIIVLASMMDRRYCPVTLTPNFDDLLYDAFYLFLEDKPLVINHDALAPQLRFTENRPAIIKLHGDYLYDNLQNIGDETERLKKNMRDALTQCLREYGLIVVGYGGNDKSIMNALNDTDIPSYGLWWCVRNEKSLSKYAKELLHRPNTFILKIKNSEELFATLWQKFGISIPNPSEIIKRAKKRAEILNEKMEERGEKAPRKEKEKIEKLKIFFNYMTKADEIYEQEKYDEAIKYYDMAIKIGPEFAEIWNNRGNALLKLKKYDEAIECYDKAIEINPKDADVWNGKGVALYMLKKYDEAIECYDKAIEINPKDAGTFENRSEYLIATGKYADALKDAQESVRYSKNDEDTAIGLMLSIISKTLLGEKITEEKRYREICSKEFTTTWDFEILDSWLEKVDMPQGKKDYIQKIMNLLRKHKAEG